MKKSAGSFPPLDDRISFLMHRINAHLFRVCNPLFERWGVDLVTSRMLVALLENGPMQAGEIVRIMALPQSTISHQIMRLEKLGYVVRAKGSKDARVVMAKLTKKGRRIAQFADDLSRTVGESLIEAIGKEQLEVVRAALKRADDALLVLELAGSESAARAKKRGGQIKG